MCWSRVRAGGSPGLLRILRFEKTRNCLLEFIISRVQALPELGADAAHGQLSEFWDCTTTHYGSTRAGRAA